MTHKFCSMTGFASGEIKAGDRLYKVQLKSVNHRFFEFRWRAPREWFALENSIRSSAKQILRRGFLELLIEEERISAQDKSIDSYVHSLLDLDAQLPSRMHNQMSLYERFDILIRNSDLWRSDSSNQELNDSSIREQMTVLIDSLNKDREREGEALKAQLIEINNELSKHLSSIKDHLPSITEEWNLATKQKIETLITERSLAIPEERIAQELILIAEKRDVAEEITRTQSHLDHLSQLINNPPQDLGKKLDFLCQELHREWTTLSNKIQHQGLSKIAQSAKLEVEKLREQAQNFV